MTIHTRFEYNISLLDSCHACTQFGVKNRSVLTCALTFTFVFFLKFFPLFLIERRRGGAFFLGKRGEVPFSRLRVLVGRPLVLASRMGRIFLWPNIKANYFFLLKGAQLSFISFRRELNSLFFLSTGAQLSFFFLTKPNSFFFFRREPNSLFFFQMEPNSLFFFQREPNSVFSDSSTPQQLQLSYFHT